MFYSIIKIIIFIIVLLSFFITPAIGKPVNLKISEKITANAEYYLGDKTKPSILILHGFLLTHNFPTVKRLAESLHESGYNILTPSLSLGISLRKKSLACEAIHTHSLEKDVQEIALWIQWLQKQSATNIILIGHSTGSIHLAKYLSQHPSEVIKKIIFIAMPDFNSSTYSNQTPQLKKEAEQLLKINNHSLHDFQLSYCKQYPSSAENYLSYLQLSQENLVQALDKIAISKILIKGSIDSRIDQHWSNQLSQHNVNVINVNGANHFFDYEHEFDLLDIIENILNEK